MCDSFLLRENETGHSGWWYSARLKEIMEMCMSDVWEKRPKADELFELLEKAMEEQEG